MRRLVLVAAVLAAAVLAVVLVVAVLREPPAIPVAAAPEPPISGATGAAPAAVPATERGAIEGTVRDAAGAPLAGVHVRLVSRGDGLAGAPAVEVRTDFEGSFRIDG
ncbi:MAG TPA: carboxypeptidase-like regulatory domain-containing protein, partial [Anaeromyxobacteraceae bacterium]|nr:carboxypeptidase-like regulatory domain-containing protein [Anaeromyxobacteraceae bacterium]